MGDHVVELAGDARALDGDRLAGPGVSLCLELDREPLERPHALVVSPDHATDAPGEDAPHDPREPVAVVGAVAEAGDGEPAKRSSDTDGGEHPETGLLLRVDADRSGTKRKDTSTAS